VVVAAFILVTGATAATPRTATITRVDQLGGRLQVAWSLPAAVDAFEIEVAVNPATGGDGSYLFANVRDSEHLEASQNTWVARDRLRPGTYYVHVGAIDKLCSCFGWSSSAQMTIPFAPNRLPTLAIDIFTFYSAGAADGGFF
jgi:hypothetical protein